MNAAGLDLVDEAAGQPLVRRFGALDHDTSSEDADVLSELHEMLCGRDGVHDRDQNAALFDISRDPDHSSSSIFERAGCVVVVWQVDVFDDLFLDLHLHCSPRLFEAYRCARDKSATYKTAHANEFSPSPTFYGDLSAQVDSTCSGLGTLSVSHPYNRQNFRLLREICP